jgi:hypothetical protein
MGEKVLFVRLQYTANPFLIHPEGINMHFDDLILTTEGNIDPEGAPFENEAGR